MWSRQQNNLFEAAVKAERNIVLQAVAGSGKTTTIKEACNRMKQDKPGLKIRFVAFNKAIVEEIKAKVPAELAEVGTMHSFCFQAWKNVAGRNIKVDAYNKSKTVASTIFQGMYPDEIREIKSFVEKLIGLAKNDGVGVVFPFESRAKYEEIIEKHGLDYEIGDNPFKPGSWQQVQKGIDLTIKGLKIHESLGYDLIDFTDMLWLPLLKGVKFWQVDRLLVDECQDLNVLQRLAAKKMLKPEGRAIFVGDKNQAIYGFAGADSESIDSIIKEFNAIELPLTVTYRCPKVIVDEARKIVPEIEAHESSPEGSVTHDFDYEDLIKESFSPEDAILCRKTAPLIELAYTLIAKGVACHVEGREIGQGLINLVNKWKKVRTISGLLAKLDEYQEKQVQTLMAKGKEQQAESLNDKIETIRVISEQLDQEADIRDLAAKIESIFADNAKNLTLSTIHKSKGREWNKVYWLGKNQYQPSKFARQDWQMRQEENLIYVAWTRAKNSIIIVNAL